MGVATTVHVALVDEDVEVWRPVLAEHLHGHTYRIAAQEYDAAVERWEFEPGEVVVCELRRTSEGDMLVAKRKASPQG